MTGQDGRRPGAAAGDADAESGQACGDDRRQALAALEIMRRRGLIDDATYQARRQEIEAG